MQLPRRDRNRAAGAFVHSAPATREPQHGSGKALTAGSCSGPPSKLCAPGRQVERRITTTRNIGSTIIMTTSQISHVIVDVGVRASPRLNETPASVAATYPLDATTPETLLRIADERMYKGKRAGRNRIETTGADGALIPT